jgi:hypothetical protein
VSKRTAPAPRTGSPLVGEPQVLARSAYELTENIAAFVLQAYPAVF